MIITRQLKLDPKFIDGNIIHKLVELVKMFEGTSSKQDGIIRCVNYLKRIVTNEISKTTGSVLVTVEIDVDLVHPKVGDIFKMTVIKIDPKALFVEGEMLKAIVATDNINGFVFNKATETFYNTTTSKHIKIQDVVNVTITAMKYANNMFKYVGKIE